MGYKTLNDHRLTILMLWLRKGRPPKVKWLDPRSTVACGRNNAGTPESQCTASTPFPVPYTQPVRNFKSIILWSFSSRRHSYCQSFCFKMACLAYVLNELRRVIFGTSATQHCSHMKARIEPHGDTMMHYFPFPEFLTWNTHLFHVFPGASETLMMQR